MLSSESKFLYCANSFAFSVAIDRETEVLREMVEALKPAARRK